MTKDSSYFEPDSERYNAIADKLERRLQDDRNPDDPNWLKRQISKWKARATGKERALEHKSAQRDRKSRAK